MRRIPGLVFVFPLLIIVCWLVLRGLPSAGDQSTAIFDNNDYVAANSLLMFVTNHGSLARDLDGVFGYDAGLFFPFTAVSDITSGTNTSTVAYAAGLWLGGKVNDTLRLALAEFASEYWPGPMIGGTFDPTADTNSQYRVYHLYADSLSGNPNTDYLEWPDTLGAPTDGGGNPLLLGDELLWAVYNDANPAAHTRNAGGTGPLGLEVRQSVWAEDAGNLTSNMIFVDYTIINNGPNVIDSFIPGFWVDPDLGDPSDDLVGCDSATSFFYCYNADNDDAVYGTQPPAVGFRYLSESLYAFSHYTGGADPASAQESWCLMNGLTKACQPYTNPTTGNTTRFWSSGDPVAGTGDLDSAPSNEIMLGTLQPRTFAPGDTLKVQVSIGVFRAGDRLASLAELRSAMTSLPTDVANQRDDILPNEFNLAQNYPNPFNPETVIEYQLTHAAAVELTVYNLMGRRVTTLVNQTQPAGSYRVSWDGTDLSGARVASGVYFYRLQAGGEDLAKKMVLLK